MAGDGNYLEKDDNRVHISRDGKRDVVDFPSQRGHHQRFTAESSKGENMRTMGMGPMPDMEHETKQLTEDERKQHVSSNHAGYDTKCELRAQREA